MSGVHVKTEPQISRDTEQTSLPCVDGTKRQQLITQITEDGKIKRCELGCVCVFFCVCLRLWLGRNVQSWRSSCSPSLRTHFSSVSAWFPPDYRSSELRWRNGKEMALNAERRWHKAESHKVAQKKEKDGRTGVQHQWHRMSAEQSLIGGMMK